MEHVLIPIGRAKDIVGERFGRLVVVGRTANIGKDIAWLCKCDCGNEKVSRTTSLRSGDTVSCGCKRAEVTAPHDITNKKFGRLTAIELTGKRSTAGDAYWKCQCECGNVTEVKKSRLSRGESRSCGCLQKELSSKRQSDSGHELMGKRFGRLTVIEPAGKKNGRGRLWLCECECGGTITTAASDIVTGRTTSCGCKQIERVTALGVSNVGERNPAHNHNLTDEDRANIRFQRSSDIAKKLRLEVYRRDGFKCAVCGDNHNRGLVAHHLDGFDKHPGKRFDINNLVTLCGHCHIDFHKEFGYGNNTKKQFEQYKATKVKQKLPA